MVDLKIQLPNDFLKEENKCGYFISREQKELWAVEMDLLAQVQELCRRHGLTYFALGGTLLGAARHQGYIPWDDDIDLLMPRKDYNAFIRYAPLELEEPYFLSCVLTEKGYWKRHLQLRNTNTTFLIQEDQNLMNNKGVFIDIMPLDIVPATKEEREKHKKELYDLYVWLNRKMAAKRGIHNKLDIKNDIKYILSSIRIPEDNYDEYFREYNRLLSQFAGQDTGRVGHVSLIYKENRVWEKELYEESTELDFEFMKINAPKEYGKVLSRYFGADWALIPKEHPSANHTIVECDLNHSFLEKYKWDRREIHADQWRGLD